MRVAEKNVITHMLMLTNAEERMGGKNISRNLRGPAASSSSASYLNPVSSLRTRKFRQLNWEWRSCRQDKGIGTSSRDTVFEGKRQVRKSE